jgi:PAS domain S-box-containing protein
LTPEQSPGVDTAVAEEAIWRLTRALAAAGTVIEVTRALTEEGPAAAGADWIDLAMSELGSAVGHLTYQPGAEPAMAARWAILGLNDPRPAIEAVRDGLPVLLGSLDEVAQRYPALLPDLRATGLVARAWIPLSTAAGPGMGAVGFGWREPQTFGAAQLRRLDLIAQLAGLALERARASRPASQPAGRVPEVLETMPHAFFSLDADLRITYVNAEGERLLRKAREDLVGRTLSEAFPEVGDSLFERQYRQALESGAPAVFEEYYAPFRSWFEVHAWPDRRGLNVYFSDVTERRDAEERAKAALRQAERANARLSFLASVSAELAGARTRAEVFERLTRAVVPAMADWCTLVVPEGDELVRVAAVHRQPALDQLAKRLVGTYPHSFTGPSPGVVVYRTARPMRLERLAQQIVADLDDSLASTTYGRTLQLLGDGPGLIVPVVSPGGVAAILTMVRSSGEPFSDADLATLEEVGRRVVGALEGADRVQNQRAVSGALQAAVLPKGLPSSERISLAAGYRAASEGSQVGGDWYDAFELLAGRIALVVGDVAGHGVEAASTMAQMRNALRAHLFASLGPWESLRRLSTLIARQEPEAFATVICAELDPIAGEVTWATAGHPAPILVRADAASAALPGEPAPPIGCLEQSSAEPLEHRFLLQPGDRLLMFTDGLVERRGVDLDIGLTHLMILAEQACRGVHAEAACEAIFRDMLTGPHEDDVCLLIADYH